MDLRLVETGNGGDLFLKGKDLNLIFGFENMIYLAMFGGNVAEDTPQNRPEGQEAFDFWGNRLFAQNDSNIQFNSQTERMLGKVAISSSGRIQIEEAIKKDLEFMAPFAKVTVAVTLPEKKENRTDTIKIGITVVEPDNLEEKKYIYIWDGMRLDFLNEDLSISGPDNGEGIGSMTIEYDFIVEPNEGIDYMIIEYDFIVT